MAIFFFTREITRFVQFIVETVTTTVVFYPRASRGTRRGWPDPTSWSSRLERLLNLMSRNGNGYQERRSEMSTAQAVLAILSAAATVLTTLAGLLWWTSGKAGTRGKRKLGGKPGSRHRLTRRQRWSLLKRG